MKNVITATARRQVKASLRKTVARCFQKRLSDEKPRILCYHGICDEPPDEWSVTPERFREQLSIVCGECNPVSLSELLSWFFDGGTLPDRAVAFTFDDGYEDVLRFAAPALLERGLSAAVFVTTGLLDGLPPHTTYKPSRPLMRWNDVKALVQNGFLIGSHTVTHPVLAHLTEEAAFLELDASRQRIADELGQEATLLAYPYGTRKTVSQRDQKLAAQVGYRAAFLDAIGPLSRDSDPHALPRCKVLNTDDNAVFRASLTGQLDLWRWIENR